MASFLCQLVLHVVFQVFDPVHTVYAIKGVTAIPLVEERALVAVKTLASRHAELLRPPLRPSNTLDTIHPPPDSASDTEDVDHHAKRASKRAVQFLDHEQIKVLTPRSLHEFDLTYDHEDDPLPSSGASTPSSDYSAPMMTVAKTLATRLSFWSRLSKRTVLHADTPVPGSFGEQQEALQSIMDRDDKPTEIIDSILAATAPTPTTAEERHSELEDKIVRECVREFTKGGMYFAYNFGRWYRRNLALSLTSS